eukprot:3932499-Rhodomonas_salina.1
MSVYASLLAEAGPEVRLLVYSGDNDAVCSTIATGHPRNHTPKHTCAQTHTHTHTHTQTSVGEAVRGGGSEWRGVCWGRAVDLVGGCGGGGVAGVAHGRA